MRSISKSKRGQMTIGDAPGIVLIIGLVFLTMATVALIGERYGDSFPLTSSTVVNESTFINSSGDSLSGASAKDAAGFSIILAINGSSGDIIEAGNYTVSSAGLLTNSSTSPIVWADVDATYSFKSHSSVAFNTTSDLNTEIANNTSIAGIILTISLVGIVLTVLIGVFLSIRRRRI